MFQASLLPLWILPTATATAEGLVTLHNFIFYSFLSAVLAFVLLAIALVVADSHHNLKGSECVHSDPLNYSAEARKILESKPEALEFLSKLNLSYLYSASGSHRYVSNRFALVATNKLVHGTLVEIVWTLLPSIILIVIAIPSFALLYSMDEVVLPDYIVRIIGHQWYWSYETVGRFNDKFHTDFDSYMVAERDLHDKDLRLLETDTSLSIPTNTHIRFLFTSSDVLHSWTVPFLGIKVDAVPGRLSQFNTYIEWQSEQLPSKEVGVQLYGQCSEICGVNHGFMPISVILV